MHAVSIVRVSYRLRIGFRKWIASGIARIASSIASRISSKSRTGSFTPASYAPHRSVLLFAFLLPYGRKEANITPSLTQGHSFLLPLWGKKERPFRAMLFQSPAHPPRGPLACRPALLVAVARKQRGQRRDSAAGSLDAPRFAPTLACASGIPPARQRVFLSFLTCVLLFLSVRYS